MDNLVLLCLIFFMCVRLIGLGVSIDFLHDTKDRKFIYFILGWVFWIGATIFPLFLNIIQSIYLEELFLVLNIIFAVFGFAFYMWAFLKYYISVPVKIMILIFVLITFVPLLLYFLIDYTVSIQFSSLTLNVLLLSAYIIPPIKKRKFRQFMGKSIRWYYAIIFIFIIYFPISAITLLSGYRYGLYDAESVILIIIYYAPVISTTILLIIQLVHLEYTISSRQTHELKDKFSHDLGNIMQVINSSSDLIKRVSNLSEDDSSTLNLIGEKCKEASKLIKEIREI